jgi:hypothetical protein
MTNNKLIGKLAHWALILQEYEFKVIHRLGITRSHEPPGLIQKVHLEFGHFGIKRTCSLLTPHYHWRGMYPQV